jgi:organic hydroperoxide reductase OsmC/OhrA
MLGTLARFLAAKKIPTSKHHYWADVEGDIENVNNVLKITRIRVNYHIDVPKGKGEDAREALSSYITFCPAAQSVIGCIQIQANAVIQELEH